MECNKSNTGKRGSVISVRRRLEAMKHNLGAYWGWLGRKLSTQFFVGITTVVPVGVTIGVLAWIFLSIDNLLQPVIKAVWDRPIPGVGFGITVVLIYLVGVMATNILGKWLIHLGESALPWLPVFRELYTGTKQIMESFSAPERTRFMQVVLTDFPRKGMRAIGFVTNELLDEPGNKLLAVYIPTSPNPTGGFLQIVGENEVVRTDISVADALKMVVSAGRVLPKEVSDKLFVKS